MDYEKIAQLVRLAVEGNQTAFGELYALLFQSCYYSALKVVRSEDDAADIVQDTMVALYHALPTLENPRAVVAYSNAMIYGKSVDLLRKQKRWDSLEDLPLDNVEDDDENFLPEHYLETQERRAFVRQVIDELSDGLRTIVLMYYFQQMTTAEICQALSLSESAVNTRLSRARSTLKGRFMKRKEESTVYAMGFILAEEAAIYSVHPAKGVIWQDICSSLNFAPVSLPLAEAAETAKANMQTGTVEAAVTQSASKMPQIVAGITVAAAVLVGSIYLAENKVEAPPQIDNPPPISEQQPSEQPSETENPNPPSMEDPNLPEDGQTPTSPDNDQNVGGVILPDLGDTEGPSNETGTTDNGSETSPPVIGAPVDAMEPDIEPSDPIIPLPDEIVQPEVSILSHSTLKQKSGYTIHWNDKISFSADAQFGWTQIYEAIGPYIENKLNTPLSTPVMASSFDIPDEQGSYTFVLTVSYTISGVEDNADIEVTIDITP